MTPRARRPHYTLIPHPEAVADIAALASQGPAVVAAAAAIADGLAFGRVIAKELGLRNISSDLSGQYRVKFDVAGQRPQRFRLIYRQVDVTTRELVAIGRREEHAIYRLASSRLSP